MSQAMQAPDGAAITTSDTVANEFRTVYVGVSGDVAVVTQLGTTLVFKAVPVGFLIPVATKRVKATGTTATNLIGIL